MSRAPFASFGLLEGKTGKNLSQKTKTYVELMAPKITTDSEKIFDVFQPGLVRGAERLPFAPHKRQFQVEHPQEGWRVYLRAACFIHELYKPFDADRFLVVKRTEGDPKRATWEPPKGQMEGKDGLKDPNKTIFQLMKENVRREVFEEAKISHVRELSHTGLVIQSTEPDYPSNWQFQQHIFQGQAHPIQIQKALEEFEWLKQHPAQFQRQRKDKREKDALAWFDPKETKMMGRWSPTILAIQLKKFRSS